MTSIQQSCTLQSRRIWHTYVFFHAKHAAVTGNKNITINSSATYVVVLAISVFIDLHINELWIAFGKGKDFRWIPVHQMTRALGPRCRALPFSTRSQAVTQYPLLLEKEKGLHGRHGMCFKLLLRYSLVSVLQSAQLQTTSLASLKNLWWSCTTGQVKQIKLMKLAWTYLLVSKVSTTLSLLHQQLWGNMLKGLFCKLVILGVRRWATFKIYLRHQIGDGKKRMTFGYHTGHLWRLLLHPVRNFWSADAKRIVLEIKCFRSGLTCTVLCSCTCSEGTCTVKKCSLSIFSSNNIWLPHSRHENINHWNILHLTTFLLYAISRKTVPSFKDKNLSGQLFIFNI